MRIGLFIKGNIKNIHLVEDLKEQLKSAGHDIIYETSSSSNTSGQIAKILEANCDLLIAAGGDGTLHECINLIMDSNKNNQTKLAIFPAGTANDFAKTINQNQNIEEFIKKIERKQFQKIDIGQIISSPSNKTSYFINIADSGIGGEIIHSVNKGNKKIGGIIYSIAIIKGLMTFTKKNTLIEIDDQIINDKLLSLVLANGNYFANGLKIAPHASLSNGLLAISLFGNVSLIDYFRNIKRIRRGEKLQHPEVKYLEAKKITISCEEKDYHIEADGEYIGHTKATFSIIPNAIEFLI